MSTMLQKRRRFERKTPPSTDPARRMHDCVLGRGMSSVLHHSLRCSCIEHRRHVRALICAEPVAASSLRRHRSKGKGPRGEGSAGGRGDDQRRRCAEAQMPCVHEHARCRRCQRTDCLFDGRAHCTTAHHRTRHGIRTAQTQKQSIDARMAD